MENISTRIPLRLGISGGGTDSYKYCKNNKSVLVSSSINIFVECSITRIKNAVIIKSIDLDDCIEFPVGKLPINNKLLIISATYNYVMEKYNNCNYIACKIIINSEASYKSGLGASSIIIVSVIKSLLYIIEKEINSLQLVEDAYIIERKLLGFEGGIQDQLCAVYNGVNCFKLGDATVEIEPIILNKTLKLLSDGLYLIYTNIDRKFHSGIFSNSSVKTLHEISSLSQKFYEYITKEDTQNALQVLSEMWDIKNSTVQDINIKTIINSFKKDGIKHIKLCGSGGGGYMIVYIENKDIVNTLQEKYDSLSIRKIELLWN